MSFILVQIYKENKFNVGMLFLILSNSTCTDMLLLPQKVVLATPVFLSGSAWPGIGIGFKISYETNNSSKYFY